MLAPKLGCFFFGWLEMDFPIVVVVVLLMEEMGGRGLFLGVIVGDCVGDFWSDFCLVGKVVKTTSAALT